MKAWIVDTDYSEGQAIVFADTRNQARRLAQCTDVCEDAPYIDIRARRCKGIDGMEHCEPKDNYWLNDEIRLIMVRDYDWACVEPQYGNCDSCVARAYCRWTTD